MTDVNPYHNAMIFGTMLCALDKMGIKPTLIARQTSAVLAPIIGGLSKQLLGKTLPSNMEEFLPQLQESLKTSGILNPKSEISYSNGVLSSKIIDCMYLTMAGFGKSLGYKACPMCAAALILSSALKAINIAEVVDAQVENKEDTCIFKLKLMEK
ncbi:MAG: hypothetical protein WED07_13410 [Candidatus Freyarchaeum deiterrae]